jgi:dienelactone hydrolase
VGETQLTFVEHGRTVSYPGRPPQPRTLTTVVRYPIAGPPARVDVRDAIPDRSAGPFPLIVFGHGFAVTPATYYRLLRAWAQAGYVVAAPVFPLEQAHAPGGPDESDLVNQPRDMSVVISGMLATSANRGALLDGMVEPSAVAVSGQSDGGETALAVAYDRFFRDPRVDAAAILSGAQLPGGGLEPGPPLLAAQGTADTINNPRNTYAFFATAHRPKYLLRLLGAAHLPPYTGEQPQLAIVERVSIAFLDRYLKGARAAITGMERAANRPGLASLVARP